MKRIMVVAGTYAQYAIFIDRELSKDHGGFDMIHRGGNVSFKDGATAEYVADASQLRGLQDVEVQLVGTWKERRDYESVVRFSEQILARNQETMKDEGRLI